MEFVNCLVKQTLLRVVLSINLRILNSFLFGGTKHSSFNCSSLMFHVLIVSIRDIEMWSLHMF